MVMSRVSFEPALELLAIDFLKKYQNDPNLIKLGQIKF